MNVVFVVSISGIEYCHDYLKGFAEDEEEAKKVAKILAYDFALDTEYTVRDYKNNLIWKYDIEGEISDYEVRVSPVLRIPQ